MREIKLKAWIPSKKKMLPGIRLSEIIDSGQRMSSFYGTEVMLPNDIIYLQYTGLKDRKETEIYAGDILKGSEYNHTITWDDALLQWWARNDISKTCFPLHHYWNPEVIGNIYEHPELIGAAK